MPIFSTWAGGFRPGGVRARAPKPASPVHHLKHACPPPQHTTRSSQRHPRPRGASGRLRPRSTPPAAEASGCLTRAWRPPALTLTPTLILALTPTLTLTLTLTQARLRRFRGALNSTSSVVLSGMEQGRTMEEALAVAQEGTCTHAHAVHSCMQCTCTCSAHAVHMQCISTCTCNAQVVHMHMHVHVACSAHALHVHCVRRRRRASRRLTPRVT